MRLCCHENFRAQWGNQTMIEQIWIPPGFTWRNWRIYIRAYFQSNEWGFMGRIIGDLGENTVEGSHPAWMKTLRWLHRWSFPFLYPFSHICPCPFQNLWKSMQLAQNCMQLIGWGVWILIIPWPSVPSPCMAEYQWSISPVGMFYGKQTQPNSWRWW